MIVLATPKWDGLNREVMRTLRTSGPGAAIKTVERTAGLSPAHRGEALARPTRDWTLKSRLHVVVYRGRSGQHGRPGSVENYGVTSRRLITNNGVAFLVDAWQNTFELEIMKYHGIGTGSTAEAAGDAALVTELTTQYNNSGDNRATGTLTETSAPVFATVGVNLLDTGATIAEHGIFSVITPGSGVLWDRSLTGSQVLSAGDSIQTTYSLTVTAGT